MGVTRPHRNQSDAHFNDQKGFLSVAYSRRRTRIIDMDTLKRKEGARKAMVECSKSDKEFLNTNENVISRLDKKEKNPSILEEQCDWIVKDSSINGGEVKTCIHRQRDRLRERRECKKTI